MNLNKENNYLSSLLKKIKNRKIKVAIIGIGYVGLPLVFEVSKKFKTFAYDKNKNRIKFLKRNLDNNNEFEKKYFSYYKKNITFTSDEKKLKNSDIFVLAIPTPVDKKNNPDLKLLNNAFKVVSKYFKNGNLIILESTVYPGLTQKLYKKYIKSQNGFLGYSPERVNPGDKKHTLGNIKKIVSGANKNSLELVYKFYNSIFKNKIVKTSSIQVAELSKLLENIQRDVNIALMNELNQICNNFKINVRDVINAAKTKWNFINFEPGLVGGHCIGVDPYYLNYICKLKGFEANLILSGRNVNNKYITFLAKSIIKKCKINFKNKSNLKVLYCGISFKENVSDIRNSKAYELYNILAKRFSNIDIYDPQVSKFIKKIGNKEVINSIKKNKKIYDVIIFTVKHNDFKNLGLKFFKSKLTSDGIFFDLKNIFMKNQGLY